MPAGGTEALLAGRVVVLHNFIPLVGRCGMRDAGYGIIITLWDAVIALISGSWDFGSVVQIFGEPALGADLDGGIGFTVADICY